MRQHLKNRDQVAHYWANRTQPSGEAASLSFNGADLFSYSARIATLVRVHQPTLAGSENTVAIFTDQRWSVTTSGHQSMARRAASHLAQVTVHELGGHGFDAQRHRDNFASVVQNLTERAATARKGSSQRKALRLLGEEIDLANRFCTFFNLELFTVPTDFDAVRKQLAEEQERAAELAKKNAVKAKRKAAKLRKEALAAAERWKAGQEETGDLNLIRWNLPGQDFMRLELCDSGGDRDSPEIVTTKNVRVSVPFVKRAARFILPKVRDGQTWQTNGEICMVGEFRLDSIEADGTIKIGCHTFDRAEVERVAALLGL